MRAKNVISSSSTPSSSSTSSTPHNHSHHHHHKGFSQPLDTIATPHHHKGFSKKLFGEESVCQGFEALRASKHLIRSVSHNLGRKNQRPKREEEDDARGISLRCLTLYGRGGGCKVGADTWDDFGNQSYKRRSNASNEGKGYIWMCGTKAISNPRGENTNFQF
ncbi:hypothetical protein PRUPE_1G085800 [Prunus persica]|uniref:Uncharacterized protein n=1 Tax=Prunus persica TaxID=3760 RepID=A0A251QUC4_PRUPE|nr:hypothetical protein PRUPE_1G085800 [Prunus persica]